MSADRHVQTQFKPGYHLRSVEHGLFTCPANKEIIRKAQTTTYATMPELYKNFVKPLNKQFGANTYQMAWQKDCKYVQVRCVVKDCRWSIWFLFDMCSETNSPINLRWERNVTISHNLAGHE